MAKKYSKDSKINLLTLNDFMSATDYLCNVSETSIFKDKTVPKINCTYYRFTHDKLIRIIYGVKTVNYGMDEKEKLEQIDVAYRDGFTEYNLIDDKLKKLYIGKSNSAQNKYLKLLYLKEYLLPPFDNRKTLLIKHFESHLIKTDYKTEFDELKNKYIVVDVETNGLRKANDDLLSISIYDPTTGICYNRFLPLDLQPLVLTGYINGINDNMIENECHLDQVELDSIIEFFKLKERIVLSYSGGKGTFDFDFINNYCKRHNLFGFDNLKIENIKNKFPEAPYGSEGFLTKDYLCKLFGIEGIREKHTSLNDCILEWKLFEKVSMNDYFFINNKLYKFNPDYIIPCTYLTTTPELKRLANISIPFIEGKAKEVFSFSFPEKNIKFIKKFPTNITGITIEHMLNTILNVTKQNNTFFLSENKKKLEFVGALPSVLNEIPINLEEDGTISAINEEDKTYIETINNVTDIIKECIKPLADYLRERIFNDDVIMSQELCISDDKKVLSLCDLSDSKNIVEIKTMDILLTKTIVKDRIAKQLYYEFKGRNIYVVVIKFVEKNKPKTYKKYIDKVIVKLYKVKLNIQKEEDVIRSRTLLRTEVEILKQITNNNLITKNEIIKVLKYKSDLVDIFISNLEKYNYIKNITDNPNKPLWIVNRSVDDITTKFRKIDDDIIIVK